MQDFILQRNTESSDDTPRIESSDDTRLKQSAALPRLTTTTTTWASALCLVEKSQNFCHVTVGHNSINDVFWVASKNVEFFVFGRIWLLQRCYFWRFFTQDMQKKVILLKYHAFFQPILHINTRQKSDHVSHQQDSLF